ncbi:MAG: VanZ family protein [Gracilimonas sp.]|nr:VanZ family protein [Gracilimonas sp.]
MTKTSKFNTRSVKLYLALLILSTALILYGTLFPANYSVPERILNLDKLVHVIMFGTWTFFYGLVRLLKHDFKPFPVFLVGAFFGLIVEILQHILPTGRSLEFMDFIADLGGTGIAVLILYILSQRMSNLDPNKTS